MQVPPKFRKFRKSHKLRIKTIKYSKGGCNFSLGTMALKALKAKRILPRQIEAARRVVSKKLTKKNKLLIRIFADTPITQKPKEVRMGKGKGSVAFWVHRLNAGKQIFEVWNVGKDKAQEVLISAAKKFPIPLAVVKRNQV